MKRGETLWPVILWLLLAISRRFQCLVKEVIKGSGKPIGEVIDFFWRIEFQLRGSPHVHSLWWIKDAPDLDTKAVSKSAPEFIDRYISIQVQMRAVERMNPDQPSFGSSSTSILLLARRPAKRRKSVVLTSPDLSRVKHA